MMEDGDQNQTLVPPSNTPSPARAITHTRLTFALIIAAVFLDVVDFSITQVALPSIRTQFIVSLADSQWIVGAYGITMAGFLLLSGRAGDIYGQKKLFISGIVLFTIASMTGGFATSLLFLVVSRAIQGIGAAISTGTAFAIFVCLHPTTSSLWLFRSLSSRHSLPSNRHRRLH